MLTNNQRNFLRKEANSLPTFFQVGKEGLSDNTLENISKALLANELIKINILKTCASPKNEIALDIASACKCEIVQIVGRTLVLYRSSKNKIYELPR